MPRNQILLWLLLPFFVKAQVTDTTPRKTFWQSPAVQISVVPLTLFAASAITWGEREEIRKLRNRYIPTFRKHYDDYLQYVPAAAVFGLNAAGVKGKNSMGRAAVSYAFSAAIMAITVNAIKYSAKVERPSGGEFNSFPSGHTANSFMNATFMQKEYGEYRHPLYGVGAYTMATATAIGRQLNNRHWISDVLAGAGIGILSTQVGYLIADHIFKEKHSSPPLNHPFPINNKPSFLELRFGAAFATSGDLTKKSAEIRTRTGFNMGLEGAWFFHKNIGIGGEFAFTSFPVKDDQLILPDPIFDTLTTGHYMQPMGVRYLNVGPFFSVRLSKNWFVTGKINAGSSLGANGNVLLELREEYQELVGSPELAFLRYKPEAAFSWSAGMGIQKRIGRNVGIKLFGNYFNSRHHFDIDILDEIGADGSRTYRPYERETVKFDHFVTGLALTAYLW